MSDCADCGCDGDCQDTVLAKDANDPCQEGYEQYGMKTKNGRKVPNCVPIAEAKDMKKKYGAIPEDEEVEAFIKRNYSSAEKCDCGLYSAQKCAELGGKPKAKADCSVYGAYLEKKESAEKPKPMANESHEQFMSRCGGMGFSEAECMAFHEGHDFKASVEYEDWGEEEDFFVSAAENENKPLNKPFRTPKGPKKFSVYVRNDKGNVVKVNFGDPNMEIKRDDPARRKSFRSRHNCDSPGPKYKARYWSCKMWSKTPVNKMTQEVAGETCCAFCGCCTMNVTVSMTVEDIDMAVSASSGESVLRIKGIAFHEGINKNGWEISQSMAKKMVKEMKGVDVTLEHPKPAAVGFTRNLDGGLREANIGEITDASYEEVEGGWNVRYSAEIYRKEMFESLQSGMWTMKKDYGVSIGGYGVPDRVDAEKKYALFDTDFTLDHLAMVYKPAYERANIEEVESMKKEDSEAGWKEKEAGNMRKEDMEATASLIYPKSLGTDNESGESAMTDESIDIQSQLDALKAELVLANSTVEQYKANEAAAEEEMRLEIVKKASEMGLKGHEDLPAEVVESLIASWESANPPAEEVVMEEATPAVASESPSPVSQTVVANYLNGNLVKSEESIYARCWNAWASAWNNGRVGEDSAPMYEELQGVDWLKRA